ncbi:hypothetical protein [Streptomyces sp. NRRL F-5650]|uniref:hypothetical protein n=1 Tax=Streptomyces sp. NRRL F-5650 TaxID=1463868 RepID=UPI0006896A4D|nr:hypothetical protein [Streptomyces sp. NRRL F-5650]
MATGVPDESWIAVSVRAHPLSRWFLVPLARPFVAVDGVEHRVRWSRREVFPVAAGGVRVSTFVRYRGFVARLGEGSLHVRVGPGETVEVLAANGVLNGAPFTPRLGDRAR